MRDLPDSVFVEVNATSEVVTVVPTATLQGNVSYCLFTGDESYISDYVL